MSKKVAFLLLASLFAGLAARSGRAGELAAPGTVVPRTLASPAGSIRPAAPAPALVVLDPGHGGKDFGAMIGAAREKDLNLTMALKVKTRLDALGGPRAALTRDTDVFIPLDQRIEESLNKDGDVFISLHMNKVRDRRLAGITVYAFGQSGYWRPGRSRRRHLPLLPPPPREQVRTSAELANKIGRAHV